MKNSRNKNNSSYILARKSYIHPYIFLSFLLNKYIYNYNILFYIYIFVNITQYIGINDGHSQYRKM